MIDDIDQFVKGDIEENRACVVILRGMRAPVVLQENLVFVLIKPVPQLLYCVSGPNLIVPSAVCLEIFLDPFDELSPLEAGLPIAAEYGKEGSVEKLSFVCQHISS